MTKPNIFNIATKELSQDAFITWLLRYANYDETYTEDDNLITMCSKDFIKSLLNITNSGNFKIEKIVADRQWENIDVWAKINDKYLLIIEDKTFTGQHSGQLKRYKDFAENWCNSQTPPFEKLICIYLKTGNESLSSLKEVQKEGFSIFNRINFLDILKKYSEIKNQIFIDFKERLEYLESINNNFYTKKIGKWKDYDWIGFYQFLDNEIGLQNWNYVSNPSGGFWCAVLDWIFWKRFPVHYQIEQGNLCFKISFEESVLKIKDDKFNANEEQDKWQLILLDKAKDTFPEIQKPSSYVHRGNWRTVAVIHKEDWLGKNDEILNKEIVTKKLSKYKNFMKVIVSDL